MPGKEDFVGVGWPFFRKQQWDPAVQDMNTAGA
jgi:hypothetical protein